MIKKEDIIGKVINCETFEEAVKIKKIVKKIGYNSSNLTDLWYSSKEQTCYKFYENNITSGTKDHFYDQRIYDSKFFSLNISSPKFDYEKMTKDGFHIECNTQNEAKELLDWASSKHNYHWRNSAILSNNYNWNVFHRSKTLYEFDKINKTVSISILDNSLKIYTFNDILTKNSKLQKKTKRKIKFLKDIKESEKINIIKFDYINEYLKNNDDMTKTVYNLIKNIEKELN